MDNKIKLNIACKNILKITPEEYTHMAKARFVPFPEKGYIDLLRACRGVIENYNNKKIELVCKDVFDITPRRYRQMADDNIVDQPKKGYVDVLKNATKMLKYQRKIANSGTTPALIKQKYRLMMFKADLAELEKLEREGTLVIAKDSEMAGFDRGRTVRDGVFNVRDKICPIIAAESDEKKIYKLLTKEFTKTLIGLAKNGNRGLKRKKSL